MQGYLHYRDAQDFLTLLSWLAPHMLPEYRFQQQAQPTAIPGTSRGGGSSSSSGRDPRDLNSLAPLLGDHAIATSPAPADIQPFRLGEVYPMIKPSGTEPQCQGAC